MASAVRPKSPREASLSDPRNDPGQAPQPRPAQPWTSRQQHWGGPPQQPWGGPPQQPWGGRPQEPWGGPPQQPRYGGQPPRRQPRQGLPNSRFKDRLRDKSLLLPVGIVVIGLVVAAAVIIGRTVLHSD